MDERFVNVYIEKMSKKIEELTKLEILCQTQVEVITQVNTTLLTELDGLRAKNAELASQLRIAIAAREQEPGITDRKIKQKIKEAEASFN